MDESPGENGASPSGRRSFNLTSAPLANGGDEDSLKDSTRKSRRRLLLAGGAVIPFITTIGSRSAFAGPNGNGSMGMGTGSMGGGTGSQGNKHHKW
jgi:hypothetical protein